MKIDIFNHLFAREFYPRILKLPERDSAIKKRIRPCRLEKRWPEYFKMICADAAKFNAQHAMQCGLEFFGADHALFSTDILSDPEEGPDYMGTIRCIEELPLSAEGRWTICEGNARSMLRPKLA